MADRVPYRSALDVARHHLQEFEARVASQRVMIARLRPAGRPHLLAEAERVLATTKSLRDEAADQVHELERQAHFPDKADEA